MSNDRILPDWIDAYMEYTYNSEPPNTYKRWCAISTIAACLQRKCSFKWEGTLFPNFYIVLVGPSSARKGTAMKQAQPFLRKLGIKLSSDAVTRQKLVQKLRKSDHEVGRGLIIHSSLTIFSKELTVFLGYNNMELISSLCDWYDCDDEWTYSTIARDDEVITNVWVNMIGATTPSLIRISLPQEAVGAGLTSRIIFVNEEKKGKTVHVPVRTVEEDELDSKLLNDLGQILLMSGEFKYTEGWLNEWIKWYDYQEKHPPFHDKHLNAYMGRRGDHVMKLCMIMNASRNGGMVLDVCDFKRSLVTLEEVEKKMSMVFGDFGRLEYSDVLNDVMRTVMLEKKIGLNKILSLHYRDVEMDTLHKMCITMNKIGFAKYDIATQIVTYIKKEGE